MISGLVLPLTAKNNKRMENRERIIELLTAVRYTTNDIEKVADEICLLFNVVGRSEQLCVVCGIKNTKQDFDCCCSQNCYDAL